MEIPHLGTVTEDPQFGWYYSSPIPIPVLGDIECRVVLEDYDEDQAKEEFHTALLNFLSISPYVLKTAEPHLYHYYQDCNADFDPEEEGYLEIPTPEGVWKHIQFGTEPVVTRRAYRDKGVYVSLECNCDWEQEHGLQIVFKNGLGINKVGPYDGHLTNSDAYAQDELEDVVYRYYMQAMTMTTPNNKQQQAETLRQMIHTHFAGVSRQGGISLHQTRVVDAYGSTDDMRRALQHDTDTQWTEVQDGWIEQHGKAGELCFLAPIGFRYYLPAYMDWFIRKGEISDSMSTDTDGDHHCLSGLRGRT